MAKRKYIISSGLLFNDLEDMEMLHEYALKGWILINCVGGFYVLEKQEPQNIIYSYDQNSVSKEDFEDYKAFFSLASWDYLFSSRNVHFFKALPDTRAIHSDMKLFNEEFKPVFYFSLVLTILGILGLVMTIKLKLGLIFSGISGALIGSGGVLLLGSLFRLNQKRLSKIVLNFKQSVFCFIVGVVLFLVSKIFNYYTLISKIGVLISSMIVIYSAIFMLFTYRVWKDLNR